MPIFSLCVCMCVCPLGALTCRFALQLQPLTLDYAEFEKLLLGLALLQARVRKRVDAFDEVLGELLDNVYKKSGVLVGLAEQ